jgi:hypothetical protein
MIPILFPRDRVVAIENTMCLASTILASVPTLGTALESVEVTVSVESDRVFVARSVTHPEPVLCRSQTSLQVTRPPFRDPLSRHPNIHHSPLGTRRADSWAVRRTIRHDYP